jgi:hypothetical protein
MLSSARPGAAVMPFWDHALKYKFDYGKVRHRNIAKDGAQVLSLLPVVDLNLARGKPRLA